MNSDEMRNWPPKPPESPRGTLPDLGHPTTNNRLKPLMDALIGLQANPLAQALVRNPDPALNAILSHLPSLRRPIQDGRLRFHTEIPKYNSDRFFFGLRYNF